MPTRNTTTPREIVRIATDTITTGMTAMIAGTIAIGTCTMIAVMTAITEATDMTTGTTILEIGTIRDMTRGMIIAAIVTAKMIGTTARGADDH